MGIKKSPNIGHCYHSHDPSFGLSLQETHFSQKVKKLNRMNLLSVKKFSVHNILRYFSQNGVPSCFPFKTGSARLISWFGLQKASTLEKRNYDGSLTRDFRWKKDKEMTAATVSAQQGKDESGSYD